jgi:predicted glycosyltransferase involved in capsule biosynthesis
MTNTEIDIQKKIIPVFEAIYAELPKISTQVSGLGWKQRNELITHVYSNYNNHEKLNAAKTEWVRMQIKHNTTRWLLNLLIKHRDLYGYFTDYKEIIEEVDDIIKCATNVEKYEVAATLSYWRQKLPDPL